jgi:CTP:molybdopterin cytidylyltransferase MocA
VTTAAVVLAAGSGSRFEAGLARTGDEPVHKLVTDFRGRPLMAWALESALEARLGRVYVVSGAVDPEPALTWLAANRPDLPTPTVVPNPHWSTGQASSLAAAVDRADADGCEAVVVGLADQPFVAAECWRLVAEAAGAIVTATFGGVRRPPVKLHRSVWPELSRTGDEGARTLIRMRPDLVSEVVCTGNPIDIDTPEDLRQWS